MTNQGNRIPANKTQEFSAWKAPEIKDGQIIQAEKLKERGPRGEIINVEKSAVIYNKMTAAQLEEITVQAYEDIHQQAYKKGFEQGQKEGHQQGLDSANQIVKQQADALKSATGELHHFLAGQDNEVEQALVNVAISIASSILRRELVIDSTHIHTIVTDAIAKLPFDAENISVFLSEHDLQLLKQQVQIPEQWHLRLDPTLSAGGCRVTTRESVVDYTLEDQFQQTVNNLVEDRYAELALDNKQLSDAKDNKWI